MSTLTGPQRVKLTALRDSIAFDTAALKELIVRYDALGANPTDLARASGLSRPTIYRWLAEDREKRPRVPGDDYVI